MMPPRIWTVGLLELLWLVWLVEGLAHEKHSSSAMEKFSSEKIVPDVIDAIPPSMLKLVFNGVQVEPGMTMTPTQVKDPPKVHYTAEDGAFYTLIMNDPDAPSRDNPIRGEWHHWLITNIPGSDVDSGDVMSEYVGSGPPKGTGLHRYIFLLFKQPKGRQDFPGLNKLTNRSPDNRANWKVKKFAARYNLGDAVAGNFYLAEHDAYVEELYKQLGL